MTITVDGPGGISIDFPDNTDHGTIDGVMRQATGAPVVAPEAQSRVGDLSDLTRGAARGLVGFAGDVASSIQPPNLIGDVRRLYGDIRGQPTEPPSVPHYGTDLQSAVGLAPAPGEKSTYAGTAGEIAGNPLSWLGPGSLGLKALGVGASTVGSELLGQATEGTKAEPIARLVGGFAGPAAAERAIVRPAASTAATAAELKQAGSQGFEAARNLGVEIKPQSVQDFAARVAQDLDQGLGVDANLAPKTHGILADVAKGPPAGGNAVATIDNLQSLRRKLGNAAGSIDKTERMAASSAKSALDDYLANLPSSDVIAGNPQAASAMLREANANYAAASRSEGVNAKVVRAELRAAAANSGQNVANTIRQRMADILINPALQRGYSRDELAQIEKIVRGTFVGNTARFAKNVFGGGGGIGTLATAGVGAAAGGLPGIALAAPGIAGRFISDASTMRQVRKLDQMLRSRAPLSAQRAASNPPAQTQNLGLLKALLLSNAATLPNRMR